MSPARQPPQRPSYRHQFSKEKQPVRIESLLSARLFMAPQLVGDRLYFVSNLGGHLSLYAMDHGGSVPEPLLPGHIALQNPSLMEGRLFAVFPGLGQILLMLDQDGDEKYQPMWVPLEGGYPSPAFGARFQGETVFLNYPDLERNIAYFTVDSHSEAISRAYRAHLTTGQLDKLGESPNGNFVAGVNKSHSMAVVLNVFGPGDHVVYLEEIGRERRRLYGVPLEQRQPGQVPPPSNFGRSLFVNDDRAILCTNGLFEDTYGLGLLDLNVPDEIQEVKVTGTRHEGLGELEDIAELDDNRYLLTYNIDGCAWLYEGTLDLASRTMQLDRVVCGQGQLAGGVVKGHSYEKASRRHALSYTTATNPTQIYTVEGDQILQHTRERVLGIPGDALSPGEDASFASYDGLRVSARLYFPAESLGYTGPRPLVYYIHGGPQSQEHPDFAWFSMPLIQFLTLNGFAVFVPNVRGSTGYGFNYMKHVVRDWGGADRLDHVHAMTEVLPQDSRIDTSRAGVVGRSYGGFMTLTLASRHPELWRAAVDMFGPYDLPGFAERVPESWKPFMAMFIGDPVTEREFLLERSPRTYIENIACPLLVVQGKNDPRVREQESRELVEGLRALGREVDYLMFEDEGHDVLKQANRVSCYDAITGFFQTHL
jgi:pimeloyl-ACP methyl ester carboxylesterase